MKIADHTLIDWRDFFLQKESCSLDALDHALGQAFKVSDGWRNHTIFLYHAAKNATKHEAYGRDVDAAQDVIQSHVRAWSDKALGLRDMPQPWMITQSMAAFQMLRIRPPAKFVAYSQKVATSSLRLWSKAHLEEWLGAAAELGIDGEPKFLEQLSKRAIKLAPGMPGHELYNLAYNMAMMDAMMETRRAQKSNYLAQAFRQIFSDPAVTAEIERVRHREEPRKLADALYWFSRQRTAQPFDGHEQKSRLEHMVADKFTEAGAQRLRRRKVEDTGHELDLSLSFHQCNFAVEVDGPSHFIRCTDGHIITLDGNSVFQTLLMREKMPDQKIVRFPYSVYYDHADAPQVWRGLCAEIERAANGVYMVDSDGHLQGDLQTRCRLGGVERLAAGQAPA